MNRNKKILSGALSGVLAASMVVPSFAAQTGLDESVIDTQKTGTINIHKIINNQGESMPADGLAKDADALTDKLPVNNIGFDYIKIADIKQVPGIIVSEDGKIAYDDEGMVQVGTYFEEIDSNILNLFMENGIVPEATYIKSSVVNSNNVLRNEWADYKANNNLSAEQTALDASDSAFKAAYLDWVSKTETSSQKEADSAEKANLLANADAANRAAQQASADADAASQDAIAARDALDEANQRLQAELDEAQAKLADSQQAYTDALGEFNDAEDNLKNAKEAYEAALAEEMSYIAQVARKSNDAASKTKVREEMEAARDAAQDIKDAIDAMIANVTATQPSHGGNNDNAFDAGYPEGADGLGEFDTMEGLTNALARATENLENAVAQYEDAKEAEDDANAELAALQGTLAEKTSARESAEAEFEAKLADAETGDESAQAKLQAALDALNADKKAVDDAKAAADNAAQAYNDAVVAADKAAEKAADAADKAAAALAAYQAALAASQSADGDQDTADTETSSSKDALNAAIDDYMAKLNALDSAAANNGIERVYTVESLEKALDELITTVGEVNLTKWVAEHTGTANNDKSTYGSESAGYTDDKGTVSFGNLPLGLYLVAETDISYHDGFAGAWNDGVVNDFINNDQQNVIDGDNYVIHAIDAHGQDTKHGDGTDGGSVVYKAGDLYHESVNPEAPVIETPFAPFLVCVPTTNTTNTAEGDVADGDQFGDSATVWQYTVDVYPKNQTTGIYKRIVDPDETQGIETLRTSEDYQIGDKITQVIWADAPKLQFKLKTGYSQNATDDTFVIPGTSISVPAGAFYVDIPGTNGKAKGTVVTREEAVIENSHDSYAIVDTMTDGLTFDKINSVEILPKSQLTSSATYYFDADGNAYIYVDHNGTIIPRDEAVVGAAGDVVTDDEEMTVIQKCYQVSESGSDRQITEEEFELRTGIPADDAANNKQYQTAEDASAEGDNYDNGNSGTGTTGKMVGSYYVIRDEAKKIQVTPASSTSTVTKDSVLKGQATTSVALIAGVDFDLVITDIASAKIVKTYTDGGNVTTKEKVIAPAGQHGWAIILTDEGLAKLNAFGEDAVVVAHFDSTLNKDAKIGEVPENMNYPELHYSNSNTFFKEVGGNYVYDYTYELQLTKQGVYDGRNVKFIVGRVDANDVNQVYDSADSRDWIKDMTGSVSQTGSIGQGATEISKDNMKFVEEAPGVYHVWGFLESEQNPNAASELDADGSFEVSEVNGVAYNTVTPAEDGKLIIKGLDSDKYVFQEIQTEDEMNLLKDTFTVSIEALDDAEASLRDGRIAKATVTSGTNAPIDITIGLAGIDASDSLPDAVPNLGIAGFAVNNYKAVDLRTGGLGNKLWYIIGATVAGGLAVGLYVNKKKEKEEN